MSLLFAFWPLDAASRPHFDPWGDPCPLDALHDADAGPLLTITDQDTTAVLFEGNASAALRAFAHDVAGWSEEPLRHVCPVRAARNACARVAAEAAGEFSADALELWQCPDPDTYRAGPPPHDVCRQIKHAAEAVGRDAAAADLRAALVALLVPVRLAA